MLFVSNAFAQATNAGEPNPMITILMFAGLFGFMYFLIIRPQRKRQKEHLRRRRHKINGVAACAIRRRRGARVWQSD